MARSFLLGSFLFLGSSSFLKRNIIRDVIFSFRGTLILKELQPGEAQEEAREEGEDRT
jgi:hypothetical protein